MKAIELTQGQMTFVDDEDYELVSQYKWSVLTSSTNGRMFAYSAKVGLMHRFLMDTPKDLEVDHKDGNSLNNLRSNMRNCTRSQNNMNKIKYGNGKFKGVDFYPNYGKWRARISKDKKTVHLGYFDEEELAAQAYDVAAKELHGEFAVLNFKEIFTEDG